MLSPDFLVETGDGAPKLFLLRGIQRGHDIPVSDCVTEKLDLLRHRVLFRAVVAHVVGGERRRVPLGIGRGTVPEDNIWEGFRVGCSGGEKGVVLDVVGEAVVRTASVPERVGGKVDGVKFLGGCPWRRGARDGKTQSLLKAFAVCGEERKTSEKYAVPAVVRDRWVGGGTGGSWHGLVGVVESSAEESPGKLPLGPRKSGIVGTGRSAASPGELEVKMCAVIPRGRRMPVDVRR